jgi:hypothetical protein
MAGIFGRSGAAGRAAARAGGTLLALATGVAITALGTPATAAVAAPRPGPDAARTAAAVAGSLTSVSCANATHCVAVGGRSTTAHGPGGTLAEKWNGTKWSVVTSPNPAGADGARLESVACTSQANCIAVGDYFDSSNGSTLPTAESWNGTKWSLVTVPFPAGSTDAYLAAVSCASATSCQASGASMESTLAEGWNGSAWSIEPSPNPNPARPNVLTGMACPAAGSCWAVGYFFPTDFSGTLTEKWNGTKWAVVHTPSSGSGELIGDACATTSACIAVGISNKLFAIGQQWNGTSWVTATPKKPSGATSSELNGAACTKATACVAVGTDTTASGSPALAEGWNGASWAIEATPAISGSTFATLTGVSCVSATLCWAAGTSDSSSGTSSPLLEKWNGASWSLS